VPDALASGVHVSSEHGGAHIAIVERVAALAGLAVGGTHEHDLALVVDGGGAHDVEYNSVQARVDSVQQDIIHRVPPSSLRDTHTRAQHIAQPDVELE